MHELLKIFQNVAIEEASSVYSDEIFKNSKVLNVWRSSNIFSVPHCNYNLYCLRWAYVYRYGLGRIRLLQRCLSDLNEKSIRRFAEKMNENKELNICSLGGGSGIDSIGVLDYLAKSNVGIDLHSLDLMITTIDICEGWEKTNKQIIQKSLSDYLHWNGNLNLKFIQTNKLDDFNAPIKNKIRSADIILIVEAISMVRDQSRYKKFIKNVLANSKKGAYLIFVNHLSGTYSDLVDNMTFRKAGAILVHEPKSTTTSLSINDLSEADAKKFKSQFGVEPLRQITGTVAVWVKISFAAILIIICLLILGCFCLFKLITTLSVGNYFFIGLMFFIIYCLFIVKGR